MPEESPVPLERIYNNGASVASPITDSIDEQLMHVEIAAAFNNDQRSPDVIRPEDRDAASTDSAKELCATLQSADTRMWGRIEESLRREPEIQRMISAYLADHPGAELRRTALQDQDGGDKYVEFSESRSRDPKLVKMEVENFNRFTPERKDVAIERVIEADSKKHAKLTGSPYTDDETRELRIKFALECTEQLSPDDGMNFWQAQVYAACYMGRLPTHGEDQAMAGKNTTLADRAWTWRHNEDQSLLQILRSGPAPYGSRNGGMADRDGNSADYRYGNQGGCVAGLRVPLA